MFRGIPCLQGRLKAAHIDASYLALLQDCTEELNSERDALKKAEILRIMASAASSCADLLDPPAEIEHERTPDFYGEDLCK